jgi:histidinol-phosphatase (PHP family)
MKTNYHTHTFRCKHAIGTDEDYVQAAISAGIEVLGFSDHTPWPLHSYESGYIRMSLDELPDYITSLIQLRTKYQQQISIKIGLECEYFEDRIKWLRKIKKDYQLDFIIFGNHYHKYEKSDNYYGHYRSNQQGLIKDYLEDAHKALKSGLYDLFAHPDLFVRGLKQFDEDAQSASHQLCQWAKQYNIPLEYNLNGLRANASYPHPEFFRIAGIHHNQVMISYDAHDPKFLLDDQIYQQAYKTLTELGCQIIDVLPPGINNPII